MERRQNGGLRRKIVQDYLKGITDDRRRLVCYLYVNNFDDYEVRRFLRISRKQLDAIKSVIRRELVAAGIQTAEV